MPKTNDPQQERRIVLAIIALKNRAAAYTFDVPRSTLKARYRGRVQQLTTYNKCFKMSKIEEESLERWIISMGNRELPPWPSDVLTMANILSGVIYRILPL